VPRPNECIFRKTTAAARGEVAGRPVAPQAKKAQPCPIVRRPSVRNSRKRRCRRDGQCLARLAANGEVQCFRQMKNADVDEMMNFLANTVELATPDRLAASLATAKTQEEREMIEFRYWLFRHYHSEKAKAGLKSINP
jgi:hypothetical protein